MKRPTGPELKLPEVKVPGVLADLYYDLRDRRLLPLLALVVVALVATPFLLGQKSEPKLSPAAEGAISALRETSVPTSKLVVVEAKPGLREYKKRLKGRTPTDPFRSTGGGSGSKGEGGSSAASSTSSTTSTSTTTSTSATTGSGAGTTESSAPTHSSPSPSPPSSGGGEHGSGGAKPGGGSNGGKTGGKTVGGGKHHVVLYTFAVSLQIVHTTGSKAEGNKKTTGPQARKQVLPATVLPGKKKQVVTYMGLSPKTRKPLFLVSDEVTGVFGEGKCVAGTGRCQLIELEPGFPETFQYGEDGERYKLKVTGVKLVVKGKV